MPKESSPGLSPCPVCGKQPKEYITWAGGYFVRFWCKPPLRKAHKATGEHGAASYEWAREKAIRDWNNSE